MTGKGKIISVSAPSGSGKTSIIKKLLKDFPELVFSISATTRPKREGETEGVDYYFISEEEFKEKIKNDEFIEWERFYDYYYGTLKSFILANINSGRSVLLEIDVKGALSLKEIFPDSLLVFIQPPSFEELIKRLKNRKTESIEDFQKRIDRAKMELSYKDKFDYIFVNDDLEKTYYEVKKLINKIICKEK